MSSQYSQLCSVLDGPDALNELGAKAKELGGSRAILVYDKGIGSTGIIEKIEKMLTDEGIFVLKFDGVLADAPKDMVNSVGQLAQDNNIEEAAWIQLRLLQSLLRTHFLSISTMHSLESLSSSHSH